MTQLPNPFINSAAHVPVASGSAGATPCPSPAAPAAQISVSDGGGISALPSGECGPSVMLAYSPSESPPSIANGGDPGAPASAPTKNPDAGALGTEFIHEIFFYARKLSAEARWFVPDYPAIYQAMLDPCAPRALETDPVWADEPPLFLQKREA